MNQRLLKNGENINSQDITLFCFPFAGGGASTYTSWIKKLKDKITVCPIQLPGREERIMEKPYTDMSELLRDLTDEIVMPCTTEKECKGKLTISSKGFVSCRHRNIDPV